MSIHNSARPAGSPLAGYYADPALVVHQGRYWLYPTSDGFADWSATAFTVFSSKDLAEWVPHGEVLRLGRDVSWSDRHAWAPAVAIRDEGVFLYFTAGGRSIGVARADQPDGTFEDLGRPLIAPGDFAGVAIDPSVFQDTDGAWYLLWGNGVAHMAPLGNDMTSFDASSVISWVPTGFREAITIHRRGDTYYASWSENDTRDPEYRVRYATSPNLTGPWSDEGVLLERDLAPGYLATGHHSITRIPDSDDWVIAYHRFAIEGGNGYRREVVFDALEHRDDGTLSVAPDTFGFRRPLAP